MSNARYALWLMPAGKVYNRFASIISKLSIKYSSPKFEPHVTLFSSIELTEEEILGKTQELSHLINSYTMHLTTVGYEDYYFRALFVKAEKTPDVLEVNRKAKEIFGIQANQEYMPHLSLLYGNFPEVIKKEIIQEIGTDFTSTFEVKSIHLFEANENLDTSLWHRVKEFSLKN